MTRCVLARQAFERTKVVAKEKLELSKAKLREVSPETAQIFNNMETVSLVPFSSFVPSLISIDW